MVLVKIEVRTIVFFVVVFCCCFLFVYFFCKIYEKKIYPQIFSLHCISVRAFFITNCQHSVP